MITPGVPEIGLRHLLRNNRASADRAALNAIADLYRLRKPRWTLDRYGRIGTFRGTDAAVENAVTTWAEAFLTKAIIVPADWRMSKYYAHGWAVAHLAVDGFAFTVGGRLVENGGGSR